MRSIPGMGKLPSLDPKEVGNYFDFKRILLE
jgi:hypothetical protein